MVERILGKNEVESSILSCGSNRKEITMLHVFECDNCGKNVKTYCYDESDNLYRFYTPPMPLSTEEAKAEAGEVSGWIQLLSKLYFNRFVTHLCKECCTQ